VCSTTDVFPHGSTSSCTDFSPNHTSASCHIAPYAECTGPPSLLQTPFQQLQLLFDQTLLEAVNLLRQCDGRFGAGAVHELPQIITHVLVQQNISPCDVARLAHVAGSWVGQQYRDLIDIGQRCFPFVAGASEQQKAMEQQRDILTPLTQRGDLDDGHVEPAVEIFAKLTTLARTLHNSTGYALAESSSGRNSYFSNCPLRWMA
jgi:hypothetical protein